MSAVVTMCPLNVFMVYKGTTLSFTIVLEEWLQYLHGCNSVPQKMRAVWSYGRVCHPTVLCCVKTQNVVIWWSVSNLEAWKPLCVLVSLLCNAHLLSFCLAFSSAVVPWPDHCCLDSRYGNVLAVFPKILRVWHAWTDTGNDVWLLKWVCFLKEGQFRILPCTVYHISFADVEENYKITKITYL